MAAPMLKAPTGRHGVSDADSGRPAKFPCRGAAATAGKTQPPCQKGQKGRKGAPRHDTHPLSGLSDLSGAGAPQKEQRVDLPPMDSAAARLRGHEPKPDGTNQTIEQAACLFSSKATA